MVQDSYQFLTSHTAEEYLKNSDTLTVVRVRWNILNLLQNINMEVQIQNWCIY